MAPNQHANNRQLPTLEIVNGFDIFSKEFAPVKWLVHPVLHEGASLLSGDPKVGKSFFALQIAVAIAGGASHVCGSLEVGVHGKVLYLALDDGSDRRINGRLHSLGASEGAVQNIDFVYQRSVLNLSNGFESMLETALGEQEYVFVVLDTLGAVLDPSPTKGNIYRAEYAEAIKLQKLAQKFGIGLLIVHHTNKAEGKNPVSRASGSHGLTGAVDCVLMLTNDGGNAHLYARPRDGEENDYSLQRQEDGGWTVSEKNILLPVAGQSAKELSKEAEEVLQLLQDGPLSYQEVAKMLDIQAETARKRLSRMEGRKNVTKTSEGKYQLPLVPLSEVSVLSECPIDSLTKAPEQTKPERLMFR